MSKLVIAAGAAAAAGALGYFLWNRNQIDRKLSSLQKRIDLLVQEESLTAPTTESSASPEEIKILEWLRNRPRNAHGLPQTFGKDEEVNKEAGGEPLDKRHDVYDAALVAILFDMHGDAAGARAGA